MTGPSCVGEVVAAGSAGGAALQVDRWLGSVVPRGRPVPLVTTGGFGSFACDHEFQSSGDRDGVIGEPLVVAAN